MQRLLFYQPRSYVEIAWSSHHNAKLDVKPGRGHNSPSPKLTHSKEPAFRTEKSDPSLPRRNPKVEENLRVTYEARQIRKHASKAAGIIAVSEFAKMELQEFFNVQSEIDVIHPGVDTKHYKPDIPAKYRKGNPSFLFVGELVKKKAVNRLIDAMALVRKEHPNAFLRIIGKGRRLPELREQIERLSLRRTLILFRHGCHERNCHSTMLLVMSTFPQVPGKGWRYRSSKRWRVENQS